MSIEDVLERLEIQKDNLEKAIAILSSSNGRPGSRRKHHLSAAARLRISKAQKKRWAEQKKRKAGR